MNILFLHSGLTVTGSVTYAAALEKAWGPAHRVFWAHDGLELSSARQFILPLRKKLFPQGVSNAIRVARFVKQNSIHILHAHSRRANMVAAMASRLTGVPYVTTAHMRTAAHYGSRLWPCWGRQTLAICETIADHLHRENRVPRERIQLLRNGIDLDAFRPGTLPSAGRRVRWITVPGRLSGLRWNAAVFILSQMESLLAAYPDVWVRFVGWIDPEHQTELRQWLERLNRRCGASRVIATGHLPDPRPLLAESSLVVAAGRSLMEAMAMGLPVVNVGERADHGLMTVETFSEAQKSNFGDFPIPGTDGFNPVRFREGVDQVLKGLSDPEALAVWGRERISAEYNVEQVARQIQDVYASV